MAVFLNILISIFIWYYLGVLQNKRRLEYETIKSKENFANIKSIIYMYHIMHRCLCIA